MAWTDEKKQQVIAEYVEIMETEFHTPEDRSANSIAVVQRLAEKHKEAVNGVRMILSKAEVYIKKEPGTPATAAAAKAASGDGPKRVSKADALQDLKNAISAIDPDLVDEEVLSKLTGKAAAYFTTILLKVGN